MTTVAYATGHIKRLNTVCGVIVLTALPISWVLLKMGAPAYCVFLVVFILEIVSLIARMLILRSVINYSIRWFVKDVFFKAFLVTLASSIIPFTLHLCLDGGILCAIVVCTVAVLSVIASSFYVGMSSPERHFISDLVLSRLLRR